LASFGPTGTLLDSDQAWLESLDRQGTIPTCHFGRNQCVWEVKKCSCAMFLGPRGQKMGPGTFYFPV